MTTLRRSSRLALLVSFILAILLALPACGGSESNTDAATSGDSGSAAQPVAAAADEDAEEIDEDSLTQSGTLVLEQYQVAWVGSGTMGGGTLTVDGQKRPFKIGGLGVGGFGATSIDATGKVYNLDGIDSFTGTYGNARLGATAGEAGKGRLWLKNPNGVVIELWTKMRGLALTGGVDGILITWDDGKDGVVDKTVDGTGQVIEGGADAVQGTFDAIKKPFD